MLSSLGYTSYAEYLASPEWGVIRTRVLAANPSCVMCEKPSQVVHHVMYSDAALLGLHDSMLAALCHACHERIEIQDGKKVGLGQANHVLFAAAYKSATGRLWAKAYHGGRYRPGCNRWRV